MHHTKTGETRIKRLAILASGQGTNLANIQGRIRSGALQGCEIGIVISNNSKSGAMVIAAASGLQTLHLSLLQTGGDSDRYERAMLQALDSHGIDIIVLAGYMKLLPEKVVSRYESRIVNVHPALLPSFGGPSMYGIRVHQAVLERGCKVSGATVHLVTHRYDEGPILLQRSCEVYDDDTPESLQQRVAAIEYELLPEAISLLVRDQIAIINGRTFLKTT